MIENDIQTLEYFVRCYSGENRVTMEWNRIKSELSRLKDLENKVCTCKLHKYSKNKAHVILTISKDCPVHNPKISDINPDYWYRVVGTSLVYSGLVCIEVGIEPCRLFDLERIVLCEQCGLWVSYDDSKKSNGKCFCNKICTDDYHGGDSD